MSDEEKREAFRGVCADVVERLIAIFPGRRFVLLAAGDVAEKSLLTASPNVCHHELIHILERFVVTTRERLNEQGRTPS